MSSPIVRIAGLAGVILFAACHDEPQPAPGEQRQALSSTMSIISNQNCTLQNGRLVNCVIAQQSASFESMTTAVPLRTVVAAQLTGTCPTKWPLQVGLSADGGPSSNFAYYRGGQTYVRRSDGGPIASLAVLDSSAWTRYAVFDQSCSIALNFTPNQIDVDTKEQAQAIIASLTADVQAKSVVVSRYSDLVLYSQAYQLMRSLATNFYNQLTNDQMQDLRNQAAAADPVLVKLAISCGADVTDQDRQNIIALHDALGVLGDSSAWIDPATGKVKTISDFLGDKSKQIIDTVDKLSQRVGSTPEDYNQGLVDAQTALTAAQAKLELASHQLASLLGQ
jgi:hypothetical protein